MLKFQKLQNACWLSLKLAKLESGVLNLLIRKGHVF
ncbi:hypothetical protein N203_06495 [Helicobacter pylori UM084]|nr:hypothetical protein N203_06495 [Helicobacter pylori UM084]